MNTALSDEIKDFQRKTKLWRRGFYFSTLLLLIVYFIFYYLLRKNPLEDLITQLDASWSTIIGIIGSIASTVSFFYAINIAYESIINSNQSERILSKLNLVLEKTNQVSTDTNKLVRTIADASRKRIVGSVGIQQEIQDFLLKSAEHSKLYVLTASIKPIESLLLQRRNDVQELMIKKTNKDNEIIHDLLLKYYEQVCFNSYELFIREKNNDFSVLIIFNQETQMLENNYANASALFVENDEDFCMDMGKQFLRFT